MMSSLSPPIKFIILFLLSFVMILSLNQIPLFKSFHFQIFRVVEQSIFNSFHPTAAIQLTAIDPTTVPQGSDEYDYAMKIYDKAVWQRVSNKSALTPTFIANQSSRATYFGPAVLLLILIIATPVNWKRKLFAFIIGFVLLCFLLSLKFSFLIDQNGAILTQGTSSIWLTLSKLFGMAFRTSEFFLLLMIPVWALSCLKSDVYEQLIYG